MMKKMAGKVLLFITCTFLILSSNVLYAGNGKVTRKQITIDNNELSNVASVALVSVYGESYYLPTDYGVYLADPLNKTIVPGNAAKERERIFKEMGCDAIYSIGIKMAVVGLGGNFFGKESGNVRMEILAHVEMPNGKKPYTILIQAESDKETLFRIPIFAEEKDKELVIDTAIKLSDQVWNLAWITLNEETQKAVTKYQESTN